MNNRERLLAAKATYREKVVIAELDPPVTVYVHRLSAGRKSALEGAQLKNNEAGGNQYEHMRGLWVAATAHEEDGTPMFNMDDGKAIDEMDVAIVDRIFTVALRVNAATEKDVKELLKNSGGGPTDSSRSGSPSPSDDPSKSS